MSCFPIRTPKHEATKKNKIMAFRRDLWTTKPTINRKEVHKCIKPRSHPFTLSFHHLAFTFRHLPGQGSISNFSFLTSNQESRNSMEFYSKNKPAKRWKEERKKSGGIENIRKVKYKGKRSSNLILEKLQLSFPFHAFRFRFHNAIRLL